MTIVFVKCLWRNSGSNTYRKVCSVVVETAIFKSLEALISCLGVGVVSHNKVVDSLNNVMSGDHWAYISASSALW